MLPPLPPLPYSAPDKSPTQPNAFVPMLCRLMSDTCSTLQNISTAARDSVAEVLCQHASSRLISPLNTPSIKRFNMHGIHQRQLGVNAPESASNLLATPGLKAAFAQNNQFVELFLHNRIDDILHDGVIQHLQPLGAESDVIPVLMNIFHCHIAQPAACLLHSIVIYCEFALTRPDTHRASGHAHTIAEL